MDSGLRGTKTSVRFVAGYEWPGPEPGAPDRDNRDHNPERATRIRFPGENSSANVSITTILRLEWDHGLQQLNTLSAPSSFTSTMPRVILTGRYHLDDWISRHEPLLT